MCSRAPWPLTLWLLLGCGRYRQYQSQLSSAPLARACGAGEWWDEFRAATHGQGGFIWDFVDQGLEVRGWAGSRYPSWAYGGDFGERVHDAQFNINGLCFPDRTPHPAMHEVALARPLSRAQPLAPNACCGCGGAAIATHHTTQVLGVARRV